MTSPRRLTVTKALAALMLAGVCGLGFAGQVAGTVVNLSGPLMARKADGAVKVLVVKSEVEQGDTLVSEKNTYAQIRFVDNSEITLKPNTTFKVESFAYEAGKPADDSASFTLVKGSLRSVTGLLGKRNKEKFQLKTPSATIGIRGTTFNVMWVESGKANGPGLPPLAPGLYVSVVDGLINVSNNGGAKLFSAGQFGFVGGMTTPPVMVPKFNGMQFAPPAFTDLGTAGPNARAGTPESVDCEVR